MKLLHLRTLSDEELKLVAPLCDRCSTTASFFDSTETAVGFQVDGWTRLLALQSWQAETLVTNLPHFLNLRAHELGISATAHSTQTTRMIIEAIKPDVVIIDLSDSDAPTIITELPDKPRLVMGWTTDTNSHNAQLLGIDTLLSSSEAIVERASQRGAREGLWFYAGCPMRTPPRTAVGHAMIDLVFCGDYGPHTTRRNQLLLALSKGSLGWHGGYSVSYRLSGTYDLNSMPIGIAIHVERLTCTTQRYAALCQARIALHASSESPSSDDTLQYMIEAATAGALILSDDNPTVKRLFQPEEEMIVYHSPEDLIEKLRRLLDSPAKLESIAAAGTARVRRDHSPGARMTALDTEIRRRLAR